MGTPSRTTPKTAVSALRAERKAAGLCPRCGSTLEETDELNQITGKPLRRDGGTVRVLTCADACGYSYRPYARR